MAGLGRFKAFLRPFEKENIGKTIGTYRDSYPFFKGRLKGNYRETKKGL